LAKSQKKNQLGAPSRQSRRSLLNLGRFKASWGFPLKDFVMSEKEIWKEIPGFPDYQVSNMGRVKSFKKWAGKLGRILRPGIDGHGYQKVSLYTAQKRFTKKIHKLMQLAFLEDKTAYIDHHNGVKTDNRLNNLRLCTNQENQFNSQKRKKASSIFKGVRLHKATKKWESRIRYNYKQIYLGLFIIEKDAALAYDKKARELFGKFAHLNFRQKRVVTKLSIARGLRPCTSNIKRVDNIA
jgi:hypothetical protein